MLSLYHGCRKFLRFREALLDTPQSGTMPCIKLVLFIRLENGQDHLAAKVLLSLGSGRPIPAGLLSPKS